MYQKRCVATATESVHGGAISYTLFSITDCTLSSKPTLRELCQLPVSKWYNLGLQLEVNQKELEKIQSKHPQTDRICQTKMFGVWLREVENPNYEKLLKALASIGRRDIAKSLCEKKGNSYCTKYDLHDNYCCLRCNYQKCQ